MASRTNLREAQELKAEWQTRHPGARFRIVDNSETMMVGKAVAERHGYEIIEDGRIRVLAKVTRFDVLEIRQCECGAEILTAAIGEISLNECKECKTKRQTRQAQELEESIRREAQRLADWDAMDEWEEA